MKCYERAFPSEQGHNPDGTWNQTYESGVSVRDYFAAKALQGLIMANGRHPFNSRELVKSSFAVADDMLAERDKP